ncbi:LacI family DNA-binding transcriptional regulator [Clostridium polynesiense]|uniref:LacI family DNA-binding transcriptional regulator n=1 Tax=Clostridium polynesiense TaxID=1325933 RepID=UPI00058B8C3F|nr:LacI family DNA-binding transcriptional regulator [Clostridium polynesiense]
MKVTIKDIAKLANVSVSAVSLVLNNKPCRISEEKRELIKKIAREHNYTPNINARSLVTNETKTFGLIIPDVDNIFFSRLTKAIETYCRRFGYALMIVNSDDEYKEDIHLIDLLSSRGIDGLFITVSNSSYEHQEEVSEALKKLTIPYIMIDRVFPDLNCSKVYFDSLEGAYIATKYLIDHGHRKISCITHCSNSKMPYSRYEGYKRAMEEHGIDISEDYILLGDYKVKSGYEAGEKLVETAPSAVFVTSDMMTFGLLKKLKEKGLRIPEDISVISYDNLVNEFSIDTEITSIEQNISLLGTKASELMLNLIKNKNSQPKSICLTPKLIIKESVKKII